MMFGARSMSSKMNKKVEKRECEEEPEYADKWDMWTDPLQELSEIEDAFETDSENNLHGKTILDVGTDCVKPLYIALKYEPDEIIGINENLSSYSFAPEIEQKLKLLTKTKINFYDCSLFDDENLKKILKTEEDRFDFVLVSKTLHHLRTGECIAKKRDQKHEHREDEKCCIYKFEEQKIFKRLLQLGNRVIIYECFYPHEKDDDKVRGRGGYFTIKEWTHIFQNLSKNFRLEFIKPLRCHLDKKGLKKVIAKLRQVDYICFYVETK